MIKTFRLSRELVASVAEEISGLHREPEFAGALLEDPLLAGYRNSCSGSRVLRSKPLQPCFPAGIRRRAVELQSAIAQLAAEHEVQRNLAPGLRD